MLGFTTAFAPGHLLGWHDSPVALRFLDLWLAETAGSATIIVRRAPHRAMTAPDGLMRAGDGPSARCVT